MCMRVCVIVSHSMLDEENTQNGNQRIKMQLRNTHLSEKLCAVCPFAGIYHSKINVVVLLVLLQISVTTFNNPLCVYCVGYYKNTASLTDWWPIVIFIDARYCFCFWPLFERPYICSIDGYWLIIFFLL